LKKTVDELVELLDVRHKLNVMVRELSLGERMKMELISAFLHQPKILFLDEPTIGLDVVSQKNVREFLRHHSAERKTSTILTSHYMQDIAELCQRVLIIDHGRVFLMASSRRLSSNSPVTNICSSLFEFQRLTNRAGVRLSLSPACPSL